MPTPALQIQQERWGTIVTDEQLELARKMRMDGRSWEAVQERLGLSYYVLRTRLDPQYRRQVSNRIRDRRGENRSRRSIMSHFVDAGHVSAEEIGRALATVPKDTRNFTARMLGDPLPGRSALDRLQYKSVPVHNSGVLLVPAFSPLSIEDHHSNPEVVK